MRCLVCNAEMILMKVVQDDTMPVPGFERRTFMCSECQDVEQRLVFTKHAREGEPETVQVAPPIAGDEPMPLEGEPETVQVAPPIADDQSNYEPIAVEQSDNEPMPWRANLSLRKWRHPLPTSKAITSLCLGRANASLRKWRHPLRASKTITSLRL